MYISFFNIYILYRFLSLCRRPRHSTSVQSSSPVFDPFHPEPEFSLFEQNQIQTRSDLALILLHSPVSKFSGLLEGPARCVRAQRLTLTPKKKKKKPLSLTHTH